MKITTTLKWQIPPEVAVLTHERGLSTFITEFLIKMAVAGCEDIMKTQKLREPDKELKRFLVKLLGSLKTIEVVSYETDK